MLTSKKVRRYQVNSLPPKQKKQKKNKVNTKEIIKMETNYIKNIKTIEKINQKLALRKDQ